MKNKQLGRPNLSRDKLGQPNPKLEEFRNKKGTKIQNNVMDDERETFPAHVPEDSSSTLSYEDDQYEESTTTEAIIRKSNL